MTPTPQPSTSPETATDLADGACDPTTAPACPEGPATTRHRGPGADVELARHRARRRIAVIAACLAVIVVLAFDVATGIDTPGRPLLSVAFYLAVPGWAVVGWLDLEDEILSWTLAIGLSIAIGILTAEAMLWVHAWNPDAAFVGLALAAAVLLVGQAVREAPRVRPGAARRSS